MILSNKPIAIIPCRLNSKRLPKKNIIKIKNKPMVSWIIKKAIRSNIFSKIIVSSESDLVASICKKENATFHKRKKSLSKDSSTVVNVCKDVISSYGLSNQKQQLFCCIYPTALLTIVDDFKKSYKFFLKSKKNSLISVSDYNLPPFQALHKRNDNWELLFKKYEKIQSNFYKDIYCDTGMFYWSSVYSLFKYNSFYSKKLGIFHIPPTRTCDLNNKNDLLLLNIKIRALDEKRIFI